MNAPRNRIEHQRYKQGDGGRGVSRVVKGCQGKDSSGLQIQIEKPVKTLSCHRVTAEMHRCGGGERGSVGRGGRSERRERWSAGSEVAGNQRLESRHLDSY